MRKEFIIVEIYKRLFKVNVARGEVRTWVQLRDGDGTWSLVSDEQVITAALWAATKEALS